MVSYMSTIAAVPSRGGLLLACVQQLLGLRHPKEGFLARSLAASKRALQQNVAGKTSNHSEKSSHREGGKDCSCPLQLRQQSRVAYCRPVVGVTFH